MDCFVWHNIKQETPVDRDWVLIAHPDYGTPMKAFYREDGPGASWLFYTNTGEHSVYEWETGDDGELIVKWWCPLPKLPQRGIQKNEPLKSNLRQAITEISERFTSKYCCSTRDINKEEEE